MDAAGDQIQGVRPRQEDAYSIDKTAEGGCLAVIADGLGGHPGGDVASREAVAEFVRAFRQQSNAPQQPPHSWMEQAILAADRHLRQRQTEEQPLRGMGTTLV
ncbi:MAG: PP2C family protein-serine/threonine phosphatase, partial [Burkholderiales bacterium]